MSEAKKFVDSMAYRGEHARARSKFSDEMELKEEEFQKEHPYKSSVDNHIQTKFDKLIDCASKCGKFDTARRLFHKLIVNCVQPDVETYRAMISGLVKEVYLKKQDNCILKWE
ncbi:pentatricopeptide repeat-containing protein [Tanacetum coccineum]